MRSSNGSSGVCSSDLCASKVCSSVDAKAACPLPAGGERRGLRPPERAFLQPRRSAKAAPVLSIVCYDVLDCTRPTEARILRGKSKRHSVTYVKQIGRASCRERVLLVRLDLGGRRIITKKKLIKQIFRTNREIQD